MPGAAGFAVVFDGKQTVAGWTGGGSGIVVRVAAMLALAVVALGGEFKGERGFAVWACWRLFWRGAVVKLATDAADENVRWVADGLGEEIVGEQVHRLAAPLAWWRLHPEEVFDVGILGAAVEALGAVEGADVFFE